MDGSFVAAADATDLDIVGMNCAGCVGRVERALTAVPGVLRAEVNLATERARISGGAPAALIAAVTAAGYTARLAVSAAAPPGAPPAAGWGMTILAALLALPLLAGMAVPRLMLPAPLQCALAAVALALPGARFFRGAWHAIAARSGSMDVLVALGISAAFGLSTWNWTHAAPPGPLYYDSVPVIIAFVRLGKAMEARARRQGASALRSLLSLRPDSVCLLRGGAEISVPLDQARVGDRAVVRPGERVPLDGTVAAGEGAVDESLLTGESLPVAKTPGDRLSAGAMNLDGRLEFTVTAIGQETVLTRIVRLVESAQADKPPIQRLVDRASAVFVPAVLLLALATFLGWWLFGHDPSRAAINAVAVLVIACPCALGLATPMAILLGTGAAARVGILIRDPAALEAAWQARLVVFDKTGTLTLGHPRLAETIPLSTRDRDDVHRRAASLQSNSEHALAAAFADHRPPLPVSQFRNHPGRGIAGTIAGERLLLGNRALLATASLEPPPAGAGTTAWLASLDPAPTLLAAFRFEDALRPTALQAVAHLHRMGLAVALLSGDSQSATDAVAARLHIPDARGALLPADKAAAIRAWRTDAPGIVMVGDGINDAPALAAADLGIALATGTDIAMQSAAITLMRGDPALVPATLDILRRTRNTLRQGLFWAFAYNLIGLPIAAAGLLNPALAGTAMALSSLCVVANALRLRGWQPDGSKEGQGSALDPLGSGDPRPRFGREKRGPFTGSSSTQ